MTTLTYAGSKLAISLDSAAQNDAAGFAAITTFDEGECALQSVPGIMREWAKVTETLVCADTNVDVKGSAKWVPVTFTFSDKPGDSAQADYATLEADRVGVGSFRLVFPGTGGTIYFSAQVSKFSLTEGGGQDDVISKGVELLIQTQPIYVP